MKCLELFSSRDFKNLKNWNTLKDNYDDSKLERRKFDKVLENTRSGGRMK